jgi:hypothetical protein
MSVRFHDIDRDFADEIAGLLEQEGEPGLAAQIANAVVRDRCRCDDSFCAMFYVKPKPNGVFGPGHRNVVLDPRKGMVVLDVVHDEVMAIEVLYNDDFRRVLLQGCP